MDAYQRLEHEFAEFCHNPNTVACSSGTAALHLALETLWAAERLDSNRTVIVPDFAMVACARAVTLAGLLLEFAEVNTLGLLDGDIVKPGKMLMAVHTYGRRCVTPSWQPVIDDLAEAHGIEPNNDSLAQCWSFYKNKVIAGEEGGMVAFKTEEQASLAKQLRNMGTGIENDFWHLPRGCNYRMSNCHAELILKSLERYEVNIMLREDVEDWYNLYCPKEWQLPKREVPWVYDLNLPIGIDVDKVVKGLNEVGIAARCGFKPLSQQEEYRKFHTDSPGLYPGHFHNPVADRLSKSRMYLPIVTETSRATVKEIVDALVAVVETVLA